MKRDRYKTAGELSMDLPFSEKYIRAAMNHADFRTIGKCPAYSTFEDALLFFETHDSIGVRIKVVKERTIGIRSL